MMMILSHGNIDFTSLAVKNFENRLFDYTMTLSLQNIQEDIRLRSSLHVTIGGHAYKQMSKLMSKDVRPVNVLRSGMGNILHLFSPTRFQMDPGRLSL